MPKTILITGGTGLIGSHLTKLLLDKGYKVRYLSRDPEQSGPVPIYEWDVKNGTIDKRAIEGVDAIIHLAGANVAGGRWTDKRKEKIIKSRTNSADLLKKTIVNAKEKPRHFISASGVNFYGMDTGNQLMTEDDPAGEGFLAHVCEKWEQATKEIGELGIKTAVVRTGVVFSDEGGALPQITKPIKFGLGAPLGSGKQYMSWIHIQDLCRIYLHILKNELTGAYNGVAPNPATNKEVTKKAARALGKPLFLPNVPGFVLKIVLGEMASMVLGGTKVSSGKIQNEGFEFSYPELEPALNDLLKES